MQEIITDARTGAVTTREMTPEEIAAVMPSQAARRSSASMSRAEFCNALMVGGILSFVDALAAAKGDWPAPFASALAALPSVDQHPIQIVWAAAQTIERMNPFILAMQAALGWTDAQADALFGIA